MGDVVEELFVCALPTHPDAVRGRTPADSDPWWTQKQPLTANKTFCSAVTADCMSRVNII